MLRFLFDANIPIAFSKTGHFSILESLFSSSDFDHELIMGSINLAECKKGVDDEVKNLARFKEETADDTGLLEHIKKYYDAIRSKYDELHQRNDADFRFIMVGLLVKPDFLVSNDRALVWFFNKYKNKYEYTLKCYTLAHFLDLIRRSFLKACTQKELLCTNLNVYHNDEIPSLFKNMKRAKCFADGIDSEKYLRRNQEVFGDYKNNAFKVTVGE